MGFTTGGPRGVGVITSPFTPKADMGDILGVLADRGGYLGGKTTAERDAISGASLFVGLMIYNTTTEQHEWFDGSGWVGGFGASTALTYQSGTWSPHPVSPLRIYSKPGGMIGIDGGFQNAAGGTFNAGYAATRVGDIPVGLRPDRTYLLAASQKLPPSAGTDVQAHATVYVQANGEVYVSLSTTGVYLAGQMQVFVSDEFRPA